MLLFFCLFQSANMALFIKQLICFISILAVQGVVIQKNVIFHKVNEITTTSSEWLATSVIDLQPFEEFLDKISKSVDFARDTTLAIMYKYPSAVDTSYAKTFESLEKDLSYLKKVRSNLGISFYDFKSINGRTKRGLFDIVGDIASFSFG